MRKKEPTVEEKRHTFCLDCSENPETCGKNPLNCMREKGAEIYFRLYDDAKICDYTRKKGA
jgi:hypothetical protein